MLGTSRTPSILWCLTIIALNRTIFSRDEMVYVKMCCQFIIHYIFDGTPFEKIHVGHDT